MNVASPPVARRPWTAAVVAVTAVGPLATDTYIASLPAVQRSLSTSSTTAQLTMTLFIAGMAVGQLVSGPVSDGVGRRRMVLASSVAFTLLSLLCAVAGSGWLLVLERGLQGLVAGVGVSVGRAVVSDRLSGDDAAAAFGTLAAFGLVGPVVAPVLGGVLLTVGDWRTIFFFLAVVGVVMTTLGLLGLPETLPPERRQSTRLREVGDRMRDLLTDRAFVAPVVVQCLMVAGFFVYIGGSSFVLQTQLGVSPHRYTLVFASNAVVMILASIAFRLLVRRTGAAPLRVAGMVLAIVPAAVLLVACLLAPDHRPALPVVWLPLAAMLGGMGLFLPASTAIAQQAGRRSAGTASALSGGLPFLVGALTTPTTGLLGSQTVLTMAGCTAGFFAAAAVAAVRLRTRSPDPAPDGELARVG